MSRTYSPSPIIVALLSSPAGNECWHEIRLLAEINGNIAEITPEKRPFSSRDGMFHGMLNDQYGYGLITWHFLWQTEEEGLHDRHNYDLRPGIPGRPRKTGKYP